MDAIHFHVRSEGQTVKKVVYIAIEIRMDGIKEEIGIMGWRERKCKIWAFCYEQSKKQMFGRHIDCLRRRIKRISGGN